MDLDSLILRKLTREELDVAVEWAAAEGWNPGLHDADVFWNTDPDGYLGAELDGELVATGSIVSYGGRYGFMGFFIVRSDLRGRGIGTRLWYHRRDTLKSRLQSGAAIGMDGVFDMQDWYARGGFEFSHRNLRMEGIGTAARPAAEIVGLSTLPFDSVANYDRDCFGCDRERFLREWIRMPGVTALGFQRDDRLCGYGVIRMCREGRKVGPLFAQDDDCAQALFEALSNEADGEPIWLDVPESHAGAMQLAERHGMKEVFGCARMYCGRPPEMNGTGIYGITTFELG